MKRIKNLTNVTHTCIIILFVLFSLSRCTNKPELLTQLTVEYTSTPLGIDVKQPRFGWQMQATEKQYGVSQTAYQIEVKDPSGEIVWNSGKVNSSHALAIPYEGNNLQPSMRYQWNLNVWDQDNREYKASSWFETGLMNPSQTAWDGAEWIGGSDEDLVFYAHYQLIFKLKYSLAIEKGSNSASVIYGANDMRLMDKYKNICQLENKRNESYIKLELDISGVDANGGAKLNIYRVGYTKDDAPGKPLKTFDIKSSVINAANKNDSHQFEIRSAFGEISITIDGENNFYVAKENVNNQDDVPSFMRRNLGAVNLNPMGRGGDYLPFGMVCEMGFAMDAGQKARFSDVEILNDRLPNNTLFKENLSGNYAGIWKSQLKIEEDAYFLDGGDNGIFVVADPSHNSTPMLRSEFESRKKVNSARLYITSRGIYEVYINGERVGEDYYNPGQTQYNKSHFYQTYDVTHLIKNGKNAIGAMMSEGWWSGLLSFGSVWNHFGDRQSLIGKLVLTYSDGTQETITTNDTDWKYYNDGPIKYSSLDLGEIYDATKEAAIEGWLNQGFDDSNWKRAEVVPLEGTTYAGEEREFNGTVSKFGFEDLKLIGQIGNNAGVFKTLTAQSMKEVRPGVFVYNMGQNFVGVPRITLANGSAGKKMVLRVAEILYPELKESGENVGMLMTENYRAALCQDIYTMKDGPQVFQPKFTSRGYQYIEITGIDEPLPLEAVQGVAVSSVRDLTADYKTSNDQVNQLWSNLVWSNVDNFLTLPTDCPQRNERMGWSGDISVFSRTATYVSNSDQFLRRHMFAMRDVQKESGKFTDVAPIGGGFGGILWGSAGITVPWEVYQQYKDIALLEEHYDAMVAYVDYLETTLDPQTGISSDSQLGDWLGPQNNKLGTPYLSTAYHIFDLDIMRNVAKVLGKSEDAARFEEMYNDRKAFFNKTFINVDGKTIGLVGGSRGFGPVGPAHPEFRLADTQTSYAVGLALGAFNTENIPAMAKNLAETIVRTNLDDNGVLRPEYSLMTGFIGTAWVSKALSDNGYDEEAYKLLQNNQYPSWLYSIDQGATTIWERLNGYTVENGFGGNNSMNSFNHYSFGAVGQWMMAYSLGIQRDEPGFQRFILQPTPDPSGQMTWAEGYYDSMYGRIKSRWELKDGQLIYETTVPANTSAMLRLPAASESDVSILTGKEFAKMLSAANGTIIYGLSSGTYKFRVKK